MNKKTGCLFSLIGFVILLLLVADYRLPICPFPWRGRNGTFYCYTRCYSEENNGIPFCLLGKSMTTRKGNEFLFPESPTALFPGLPLLLLEQFVICPIIDTMMIPYDLYLQSQKSAVCKEEGVLIKVQDRSGRPIQGLEIDLTINGKPGHQIFYALNPAVYMAGYGFMSNAVVGLTRDDVIAHPLFTPFGAEANNMHSTNLFTIADETYRKNLRAKFLGDAIPATSFASGRNAISIWGNGRNLNFAECKRSDAWPRNEGEWRHSDIRDVAYFFLAELYRRIVNGSGGSNE